MLTYIIIGCLGLAFCLKLRFEIRNMARRKALHKRVYNICRGGLK